MSGHCEDAYTSGTWGVPWFVAPQGISGGESRFIVAAAALRHYIGIGGAFKRHDLAWSQLRQERLRGGVAPLGIHSPGGACPMVLARLQFHQALPSIASRTIA